MRISKTLPAATLGLALALGACSGGGEADDSDGAETAESEAGAAEHGDYVTDENGEFTSEVGAEAVANINERLAEKHSEGGHDIHVLMVGTTNGEDSDAAAETARAATDADAMIYIAVEDQEVAVVGENIDQQESAGAANAITTAFDNGNFENGILNGVTAAEMHMED